MLLIIACVSVLCNLVAVAALLSSIHRRRDGRIAFLGALAQASALISIITAGLWVTQHGFVLNRGLSLTTLVVFTAGGWTVPLVEWTWKRFPIPRRAFI